MKTKLFNFKGNSVVDKQYFFTYYIRKNLTDYVLSNNTKLLKYMWTCWANWNRKPNYLG